MRTVIQTRLILIFTGVFLGYGGNLQLAAQAETAEQALQKNPAILGMPGYVLNQETGMNRIYRQKIESTLYPDASAGRDRPWNPDVIIYTDRNGNVISQEEFIDNIKPPGY